MNSAKFFAVPLMAALASCLFPQSACAASFGHFTYSDKGSSITITGCSQSAKGALVIPSSIEGKPVTSIRDEAFIGCNQITAVTIPNSVTHIGGLAFGGCAALVRVSIPESIQTIEDSTFDSCPSLSDINRSEEHTSELQSQ